MADTWIGSSWHLLNGYTATSWSYTWGRQTAETFPFMGHDHTFHPMQWSGNMNHVVRVGPIECLHRELNGRPKSLNVMGFNEPGHATQGNVPGDEAAALWRRLEALGMPLVAPALISSPGSGNWTVTDNYNFLAAVKCRAEYVLEVLTN